MRLAYITNSTLPSDEANAVQVTSMAGALSRRCTVTLVARRREDVADTAIQRLFNLPDTVQLELDLRRRSGPMQSVVYVERVRRMLQSRRIGAAYGRDPIGLLAGRAARLPCVYEIHHPPANRRRNAIERALFRSGRVGLVFISEALAAWYRESRPETTRLPTLVAPDGADPIPDAPPAPRTPGPPRLGYFGSLNAGKGLELITLLAGRLGDAEIHVTGGRDEQIAAWRERGISDSIEFHGWQPHDEVLARMRDMDVLLAPYQASSFGAGGQVDISSFMSPLKIFEYMAAGRPIVASDLPVLHEVLVDGETALLRDPDDPDAWAAAVERLLGDRELAAGLANRAYERLVASYTWDARAGRILDFALEV